MASAKLGSALALLALFYGCAQSPPPTSPSVDVSGPTVPDVPSRPRRPSPPKAERQRIDDRLDQIEGALKDLRGSLNQDR